MPALILLTSLAPHGFHALGKKVERPADSHVVAQRCFLVQQHGEQQKSDSLRTVGKRKFHGLPAFFWVTPRPFGSEISRSRNCKNGYGRIKRAGSVPRRGNSLCYRRRTQPTAQLCAARYVRNSADRRNYIQSPGQRHCDPLGGAGVAASGEARRWPVPLLSAPYERDQTLVALGGKDSGLAPGRAPYPRQLNHTAVRRVVIVDRCQPIRDLLNDRSDGSPSSVSLPVVHASTLRAGVADGYGSEGQGRCQSRQRYDG